MSTFKYKEGDTVRFDNGVIRGIGHIVGQALIEVPGNGATWILKLEQVEGVDNKTYPFSCLIMADIHIKE